MKSLAWAFVIGCLSWAGYLQGGLDSVKKDNGEQDVKATKQEEKTNALNEKIETHLMYMRESLVRIETQLKER